MSSYCAEKGGIEKKRETRGRKERRTREREMGKRTCREIFFS